MSSLKLVIRKFEKTIRAYQHGICCDIFNYWDYVPCSLFTHIKHENFAISQNHWYCRHYLIEIWLYKHFIDNHEFLHCLTLPKLRTKFNMHKYDNIFVKPFDSNFLHKDNNMYISFVYPNYYNYFQSDDYNVLALKYPLGFVRSSS